jgi:TRAP-type C4-dicarboxylate transport system permease small subunit
MIERTLRYLSLVGTAALVVGVLLTITDIVLRSVSTLTVLGMVDIMELCVMVGAMLAIPQAVMTDQHVAIDVFTDMMPQRVQLGLRLFAALLGMLFLGAVTWFGFHQAMTEMAGGDRSQTIGIPMIWYWAPFLAGMGLSVVAYIARLALLLRDGLPPKA